MGIRRNKKTGSDIYVYLGPTIHGTIQHGTIFKGNKEDVLTTLESAIAKYPLIPSLIVSWTELPVARIKIKQTGNLLNKNYQKLALGKAK